MSEQEPGHGGDVNPSKRDWVHFDEQSEQGEEKNEENRESTTNQVDQTTPPPQITPQSIVIDASKLLESSGYAMRSGAKANGGTPPTDPESPTVTVPKEDEPFRNGKIICAVYPENTTMAWVVPARYNPYSMPRSLADDRLKLPSEDYVTAMEMITNDYRFRCYCIFYSRLMAFWISISVLVLLLVLLSQPNGGLGVLIFSFVWIILLLLGIFCVLIIRKHMLIGLRHCVQAANKLLIKSDMLAGVEDRGLLSCHKIVVIFMYFRTAQCKQDIERLIRQENLIAQPHPIEMNAREVNDFAIRLILKYSQNFVKETSKKRLLFPTRPVEGVSEFTPKHCTNSYCICQYVEKRHFKRTPREWYERLFW